MNGAYRSLRQDTRVVFFAVFAILLACSGELSTPYIAHDDLPLLFDRTDHFWPKTLEEGRWITYLWSQVSIFLTPRTSFLSFILLFLCFLCSYVRRADWVTSERMLFLAALVVSSAAITDASGWPTYLIPSVALLALFAFVSSRLTGRHERSAVLVVFTFLVCLAHPSFAYCILLFRLSQPRHEGARSALIEVVLFFAAMAAALLTTMVLNHVFHGYFGVKIADWRQPHPADSVDLYLENLGRGFRACLVALQAHGIQLICWIAGLLSLLVAGRRRAAMICLLALAACFAGHLVLTAQTGVFVPLRGFVWLPFALTMPWLRAARLDRLKNVFRVATAGVLLVALASFNDKAELQRDQLQRANAIARRARSEGVSRVFVVSASSFGGFRQYDLSAKLNYQFDTTTVSCDVLPQECEALAAAAQSGIFKTSSGGVDTLVVKL